VGIYLSVEVFYLPRLAAGRCVGLYWDDGWRGWTITGRVNTRRCALLPRLCTDG